MANDDTVKVVTIVAKAVSEKNCNPGALRNTPSHHSTRITDDLRFIRYVSAV